MLQLVAVTQFAKHSLDFLVAIQVGVGTHLFAHFAPFFFEGEDETGVQQRSRGPMAWKRTLQRGKPEAGAAA